MIAALGSRFENSNRFLLHRHTSDRLWKVSGSRETPSCWAQMIFHSSNTWVGSRRAYVKTKTSQQTSNDLVSASGFSSRAIHVLSHWTNSMLHMAQAKFLASLRWSSSIRLDLIDF